MYKENNLLIKIIIDNNNIKQIIIIGKGPVKMIIVKLPVFSLRVTDGGCGFLKKLSVAADHYVMARGPQGWDRRASRADRISPSRLKKVS